MLYVVILWWMLQCFISGYQGNITSDCRQLAPQPQTIANWPKPRHKTRAGWKRARGSAGLPRTRRSPRAPWRGWLGGAARPRALEQVHPASAMLSRWGNPPAPRAWLHNRSEDCRETGNILTASGNTKNCMQRTAATTYHTAGKLQRGKAHTHCPAFRCKQMWSQTMKMLANPEEINPLCHLSPPFTLENSYFCTSKGHALCITSYVRSK